MLYGTPDNNFTPLLTENQLRKHLSPTILPAELTNENLESTGYLCFPVVETNIKATKDLRVSFRIFNIDGEYTRVPVHEAVPEDEKEAREAQKWVEVRELRDSLLKATDVHFLADAPRKNNSELLAYREALRNVPSTSTDPFLVHFPQPYDPAPVLTIEEVREGQNISKIQAMRVMKQTEGLWEAFNALLDSNTEAKEEWQLASELSRTSAFVVGLSPALGLTEEQVDALFTLGATL